MVKKPQHTGCTTIELPNKGVANGIISLIATYYPVEYNENRDVYEVDK